MYIVFIRTQRCNNSVKYITLAKKCENTQNIDYASSKFTMGMKHDSLVHVFNGQKKNSYCITVPITMSLYIHTLPGINIYLHGTEEVDCLVI